ncbi:CatB-related O-acetyltransferase [Vibrio metschnikovii]|uniref:CatB-related O-acetyltransferase n=1 Tax=Vibrio metschnikovii TaxID=28172 RepID=UPI002FC59536
MIAKIYRKYIYRLIGSYRLKKKDVYIHFTSFSSSTYFEGRNKILPNNDLKFSNVGFGTYIGARSCLNYSKIGRYCSIANNVLILKNNHPTKFVSTHPCFHRGSHMWMKSVGLSYIDDDKYPENDFIDKENKKEVIIGSDVWIGEGARILPNVHIGDGAVIAAGAIVTKSVPNYAIVGGVPAKLLKYRFNKEQIDKLIEIKWWNEPEEKIRAIAPDFDDIEKFINKYSVK